MHTTFGQMNNKFKIENQIEALRKVIISIREEHINRQDICDRQLKNLSANY